MTRRSIFKTLVGVLAAPAVSLWPKKARGITVDWSKVKTVSIPIVCDLSKLHEHVKTGGAFVPNEWRVQWMEADPVDDGCAVIRLGYVRI